MSISVSQFGSGGVSVKRKAFELVKVSNYGEYDTVMFV